MAERYDFSGYATRCNIKCTDGRTIKPGAFAENDGDTVPLVWMHRHDDPDNVLGHAYLENRPDGVYAYCSFNDTPKAQQAKAIVKHGDVAALSIYANRLKQIGGNVIHGCIREVSLVLAGANKGAYIDNNPLALEHADGVDPDDAIIYSYFDDTRLDLNGGEFLEHSDDDSDDDPDDDDEGEEEMAENANRTYGDVYDEMTDEQRDAVAYIVDNALENAGVYDDDYDDEDYDDDEYDYDDNEDYGEDDMVEHDVFAGDDGYNSLQHSDFDFGALADNAKRLGSWREAVKDAEEDGTLSHADLDTTGMTLSTGSSTYGFNDPDMLFPEYKELNDRPAWIKRDTGWVDIVLNGVKHSPMSRIKTTFANITNDEARARGYLKGHMKKEEVFSLLRRSTDPTTIYKKQKMDRDDVIDITGFDVLAWIKGEMRLMLNEELARAILVGDGRLASDEDKIDEDKIKPVATDKPLFTITKEEASADVAEVAKTFVDDTVIAMEDYQGSGTITAFIRKDLLTRLTLLKDGQGYRLYKTRAELASAMMVDRIVPMPKEIMGNYFGIMLDLSDYTVGADKGGAVSMFDDFDIDYNQQKYLIETRCSGMLTKPFSAVVFKAKAANAAIGG